LDPRPDVILNEPYHPPHSGPLIIPKRLHNMIGRDSDVSCSALDHGQDGSEDSTYCANFQAVRICSGGHGEIVAEQFVGPVNQMDIHRALIGLLQAMLYDPARDLREVSRMQQMTPKVGERNSRIADHPPRNHLKQPKRAKLEGGPRRC
jgi:hypothetical protein